MSASKIAHLHEPRLQSPVEATLREAVEAGFDVELACEPVAHGWARWVLPGACTAKPGDRVLVTGEDPNQLYIIGVLDPPADPRLAALELPADDPQRLDLVAPDGARVLSYDLASGEVVLYRAQGDLALCAEQGSLRLSAAQRLMLDADRVMLRAESKLDLRAGGQAALGPASDLGLSPEGLEIRGALTELISHRIRGRFKEADLKGARVDARIDFLRTTARRIEQVADLVIEKSVSFFREVSRLDQLRARRKRTIVEDSVHLKARNVRTRAEEDYKVRAQRVHLG